jgi:tetratricopeptide (TPR) repeat protein
MAAALSLQAEEAVVEFVDGAVEVQEGSEWIEVGIGDSLAEESTLRIGPDSLVELSGLRGKITITAAGTYALADLLRSQGERKTLLGGFMKNALARVVSEPEAEEAVSMGVRAAEAEEETFEWMDEEEELLIQGKDLLADGLYAEALELFTEAEELWDIDEEGPFGFYIGVTYAMLGETGRALQRLLALDPPPWEDYFADWAVLTGQLLMESMDYGRAVEFFHEYLRENSAGAGAQTIWYLTALCERELGHVEAAAESFRRAYTLDPDSELGRKIASEESVG